MAIKQKITMPHDSDIEKSILSTILVSDSARHRIFERVKAGQFYTPKHQQIFDALKTLYQSNKEIDILTLSTTLDKEGQLTTCGGRSYLAEVSDFVVSGYNADTHTDILIEHAMKRATIEMGQKMVDQSFDSKVDFKMIIETTQSKLLELVSRTTRSQVTQFNDVLGSLYTKILDSVQNKSSMTGISTGFEQLDAIILGLKPAELAVIAARPSIGKTSFATNIAYNVAQSGKGVLFFSLEMSAEQLVMKVLSQKSNICSMKIQSANLTEKELFLVTQAQKTCERIPLYFEETGALSTLEMRSITRQKMLTEAIDVIVIDYLQLMRPTKEHQNRTQEVSEVFRDIKAFAKELNIPIVVLSQLNRQVSQRSDKTPQLSDLRETGEIEQTADIVMFLNRDDYYEEEKQTGTVSEVDLVVAKNRTGATGKVKLTYRRDISEFKQMELAKRKEK